MIRRRRLVVALLATATLVGAYVSPAQATPGATAQPVVEFVVSNEPRSSTVATGGTVRAPGEAVWLGIIVNDIWRGEVGLVSHTGGFWELYVCDDRADGVQLAARIDPGDGRVLPYYDSDTNGLTCYERDIWYDVRKFRAAWGSAATPWAAPPPL